MGERKKRSGRLPKTEGKKSRFVNVRFTDAEVEQLGRLGNELNLSRTDFIRKRALEGIDIIFINSTELIASLDRIGRELGYAGNNINQMARHANILQLQGKFNSEIIFEFNRLFELYLVQQQGLEATLRKVIRTQSP
jgi:hypothetical protein